jgi:hypothetical protein
MPEEEGDPEQPIEQGDPELPAEPPSELPTTPPADLPTAPPPGMPPQPAMAPAEMLPKDERPISLFAGVQPLAPQKQQTPTYSLAITGSSVKVPIPVVTLDDQYVQSTAAMQAAMARGIMPLCRNPDGSMSYYHFDMEHTRPGGAIVLRKA